MKYLLLTMALLAGCTDSRGPSLPAIPPVPVGLDLFALIAYWVSGLAGLAFIAGVLIAWVRPKLGQQVIVMAVSALVGAQIMLWIDAYLVWISAAVCAVGLAYVAHRHKEDFWDGDTERIERGEFDD